MSENVCCGNIERKLRILAIHGYRQNADVFKQKTGSFRKLVHKWAQFTYITAPHKVTLVDDLSVSEQPNIGQSVDDEQYGWFFNRDDKTFRGIRKGGPAIGYEESVKFIEEVFEKEGPFDGLMGFSQGACFVGLLCYLQEKQKLPFKFQFAILASGFKSNSLPHAHYYEDPISLKALHIYGENDNIIPTEMSEQLAASFEHPLVVRHPGGHFLPGNAAQKKQYQLFFQNVHFKYDKNVV